MIPRILLVDDHQIVRQGVRALLAEFRPDWEVCGEAENAREALEAVANLRPDVTILDVTMPGRSGLELALTFAALGLPCKILIFTMHDSERLGSDVRAGGRGRLCAEVSGCSGFCTRDRTVLDGGTFFGRATNRVLAESARMAFSSGPAESDGTSSFVRGWPTSGYVRF